MMGIYRPETPIQWNWIELSGPDARDFLHRVTTVHVNALQEAEGSSGCLLSAQGKIRAWFTLWNLHENSYAFELDGGAAGAWKQGLLAALDQYTFAEKMTLTDRASQLECRWVLGDPS